MARIRRSKTNTTFFMDIPKSGENGKRWIKSDDDEPGTLFKMGLDDLVSKKKENFSLHQLKLIDSIKLISIENTFPETMILGIVPKDTKTFSDKLSKELIDRLPFVYDRILDLIKDFLK